VALAFFFALFLLFFLALFLFLFVFFHRDDPRLELRPDFGREPLWRIDMSVSARRARFPVFPESPSCSCAKADVLFPAFSAERLKDPGCFETAFAIQFFAISLPKTKSPNAFGAWANFGSTLSGIRLGAVVRIE
jgi:hypothetical protein